jgi:hypothetical protein
LALKFGVEQPFEFIQVLAIIWGNQLVIQMDLEDDRAFSGFSNVKCKDSYL